MSKLIFLSTISIVVFSLLGCRQLEVEKSGWPMFRGNLRHTGVTDIKAVQQVQECELIWKFQTGDKIKSSPAIVDGMVFFGSNDDHLYAVDIKTGQRLWKFKTGSCIISSAAIADRTACFGSKDNHFYAVDTRTGKEKWKFKTGNDVFSSPAIYDGMVYFGSNDRNFYALALETGKEKWRFQTVDMINSSPAIDGPIVYFGSEYHHLYALDLKTGKKEWELEIGLGVSSSPAVYDGMVYFGGYNGYLYAVDTKTKDVRWKFKTGDSVFSSPAIAGGVVYFGSEDKHVYAVDIKTGKEKWRFRTNGGVFSSPVVSAGAVFFGSKDGNFYAVDMKTGEEKWRFQTEREIFSSPAAADGAVYFGSKDGNLYALGFTKQKKQVKAANGKLFPVKEYGKWGYINKNGDIIIKPRFDEAGNFCEGMAAIKMNGKWGYIDQTGNRVIESRYDGAGAFSEGLAAVKIDSKYGYIDKKGRVISPPQFDKADAFSGGLACVEIENRVCYIDRKGNFVWRPKIDADKEIISVLKKYFNSKEKMYREEDEGAWKNIKDTIHEQSSLLKKRIPGLEMFSWGNSQYLIKSDLKHIEVVERNDREAKVECVQILKQIKDRPFRNKKVIAIYTMKRSNGDWKIFDIEVIDIEYLDELAAIPVTREDFISRQANSIGKDILWTNTDDVVSWVRLFSGPEWDNIESVQQTLDEGYILAGFTSSIGEGESDFLLIKTDTYGKKQWLRTFGGSKGDYASSVKQTLDGGYILAGGTSSYSPYGPNNHDVWIIKTDPQGDKQWDHVFVGPNDDIAESVRQTSDGGYIMAGRSYSGHNNHDVLLLKTDARGIKQWEQTFGGPDSDTARCVQQTPDGGYILAARTSRKIDPRTINRDALLIKTDGAGNKQWERNFRGDGNLEAEFVGLTTDGGYILCGSKYLFTDSLYDAWLVKTDSNGNKQWEVTFGGAYWDMGVCAQQTSDGGFILAGRTQSFGAGDEDIWLIKMNNHGQEEWEHTFGGLYFEMARFVQQTSDGGYILVGSTKSYGDGNGDVLLIKMKPEAQHGKGESRFSDDFAVDNGKWAEYDPKDKIELDYSTDHRLEFNDWKRYDPGYVFRPSLIGDFILEYEINITGNGGDANPIGPGFSDILRGKERIKNGIYSTYYAGPGGPRIIIETFKDYRKEWGFEKSGEQPNQISIHTNTTYYVRLERYKDKITLGVFPDADRTRHIPGSPKTVSTKLSHSTFYYFYAIAGYAYNAKGNWEWTSGWIDNIKIKRFSK
jgi:outer membrane protein assembly factor BamB